jgi:hypothetical protein
LEQADWLRENYLRMLVAGGVTGQELRATLAAIERVDRRLETSGAAETLPRLLEQSQRHFEQWCLRHGVAYDQLDEDQVRNIVDQAIQSTRSAQQN